MNRISCVMSFEVAGALLNGCPDWNNAPRTLNSGIGWATNVSISRKLRDMLSDPQSDTYKELQKQLKFDPEKFCIFESLYRGLNLPAVEAANAVVNLSQDDPDAFLAKYWDIRLFGTTLLEEKGDKANGRRFKRTGPVTINNVFSVAPINIVEATITKKAPLQDALLKNEQGTMAPMAKKFVEHGVYTARIGFNPTLAHHTKTTEEDLVIFKNLLKYTFSTSTSSARPTGTINIIDIWWAEHTNALGSFNEFRFFESLKPVKTTNPGQPSVSIREYEFPKPNFDFPVENLA